MTLKKNILDKAVKQFKEHTDIEISYVESRKRAKKVLAVEFTIRANKRYDDDYLSSLKNFIAYIRENYTNQEIDINESYLCVLVDGYIMDVRTMNILNKNEAKIVWERWYQMAKNDELYCLKNKM